MAPKLRAALIVHRIIRPDSTEETIADSTFGALNQSGPSRGPQRDALPQIFDFCRHQFRDYRNRCPLVQDTFVVTVISEGLTHVTFREFQMEQQLIVAL